MSLNTCDADHDEIVYEGRECPFCKAKKEWEDLEASLKREIQDCEDRIEELQELEDKTQENEELKERIAALEAVSKTVVVRRGYSTKGRDDGSKDVSSPF